MFYWFMSDSAHIDIVSIMLAWLQYFFKKVTNRLDAQRTSKSHLRCKFVVHRLRSRQSSYKARIMGKICSLIESTRELTQVSDALEKSERACVYKSRDRLAVELFVVFKFKANPAVLLSGQPRKIYIKF